MLTVEADECRGVHYTNLTTLKIFHNKKFLSYFLNFDDFLKNSFSRDNV